MGVEALTWKAQIQVNQDNELFIKSISNDGLKNTISYRGSTYRIYGFEGAGMVRNAYPVYTPVYMPDSAFEMMVEEVRKTG